MALHDPFEDVLRAEGIEGGLPGPGSAISVEEVMGFLNNLFNAPSPQQPPIPVTGAGNPTNPGVGGSLAAIDPGGIGSIAGNVGDRQVPRGLDGGVGVQPASPVGPVSPINQPSVTTERLPPQSSGPIPDNRPPEQRVAPTGSSDVDLLDNTRQPDTRAGFPIGQETNALTELLIQLLLGGNTGGPNVAPSGGSAFENIPF